MKRRTRDWGRVPVVWVELNSRRKKIGNSTAMQIVRFWGTYMYKLHANSTKVQAVDSWVFEPALVETESGIADLQFGYQSDQAIVRLVE
jgi:hypothetical protein